MEDADFENVQNSCYWTDQNGHSSCLPKVDTDSCTKSYQKTAQTVGGTWGASTGTVLAREGSGACWSSAREAAPAGKMTAGEEEWSGNRELWEASSSCYCGQHPILLPLAAVSVERQQVLWHSGAG